MNVKKHLLGVLFVSTLFGFGHCEESHKIVKRPGQNPLKCYKEDGVSQCVEIKPEDTEGNTKTKTKIVRMVKYETKHSIDRVVKHILLVRSW